MTRRSFMQVTSASLCASSLRPSAGEEDKPIRLFNGKNLDGFYTFLREKGKNNDPDKVFTVHDGMIHVSGSEFGHFITESEYANYHLVVEFKWGTETHHPRKDRARDSGILYHYVGPDKVWGKSIECQMIEGGTGDIIVVDGASIGFGESMRPRLAGKLSEDGKRLISSRLNWYHRSPEWKDEVGFRGTDDVEKPAGEWNTVEVIALDDRITHILNGIEVNKASEVEPTRGKILFQSEGAEVFFRKIELRPLK